MKCPKCGFNSFEFLESCKKCGAEFGSFKQSHGINPVILRPGAVPAAAPAADVIPEPAAAEAMETVQEDADFSWSAPEETPAPQSGMDQADAFDFSLTEPVDAEPAEDSASGNFSFEEQPEPAIDEQAPGFGDAFRDEFSFDDSPLDLSAADTGDGQMAEAGGYGEDLLDPLSLSAEADKEGENAVLNEFDFSSLEAEQPQEAAPAAAAEDEFFVFEEIPAPEKPQEQKPAAGLDDFDKEFKEIFAFEETMEENN